jgi:hypothetical protein
MPAGQAITTTCLLCPYHGRSDHVKRHIIKQHGGIVASDTIRLVGRVAVLVNTPYSERPEIKHYRKGVCLDCGTAICKHRDDKNHLSITFFEGHSCKAKQQRDRSTKREVTVPVAAAESTVPIAAPKPAKKDNDSIDIDEYIEDDYRLFFDQIYDAIDAADVPQKQKERLESMLENNREYSIEDDEKTDYRSTIMAFIKEMLPNA